MQNLKAFVAIIMASLTLLMVSCETEGKVDPNNPPKLVLDTYTLNIDGGGGDIPLYYKLTNPVKGGEFEVSSTEEWVSLKEVTSTTIVLHIEPSDSKEERLAMVTIKYPGMQSSTKVTVLQDKQILNNFTFEVSNVTYNGCTVHYKPIEKSLPYMANVIDAEYFKHSGVSQEEAFIEAEMSNYIALAERNNMSLEELMGRITPQLIYTGDAVRQFTGMQPGATYVIYSYGITFTGNSYTVTTPMHSTIVELPMPQLYDIQFKINNTTSGTISTINIDPGDWSGYYSVQIAPDDSLYYVAPGTQISEGIIRGLANKFFTNARNAMKSGATAEQFLRSNCYSGPQNLTMQLQPDKDYMVIVFAVESKNGEIPVMRSMPSIKYI